MSGAGLGGCGGGSGGSSGKPATDEELITQAVDAELTAIKSLETEAIKASVELFKDGTGFSAEESNDVIKAMVSNATFEVKDIKVDGDAATATITVVNTDMAAAQEKAEADIRAWSATLADSSITQEEALKKASECLIEAYKDSSLPTVTHDVTVTFTKTDGKWTIDNASELVEALG